MKIILTNPKGFCAGVKRAILIVNNALKFYDQTIYVKHELVHNEYVINEFRDKGVVFFEKISQIPDYSIVVFSAQGVSKKVEQEARKKKLTILNATCPLVKKVHIEVSNASKKGIDTIFIGHKGHPEVKGTIGQYTSKKGKIYLIESIEDINNLPFEKDKKLNFFTQTTLSIKDSQIIIDFLKKKFPKISGPRKEDICYATTNRQIAVLKLSKITDMILVIGSKNSSNANRLAELGKSTGKFTRLINSFNDIKKKWLKNINYIGITASASTPNVLIQEVVNYLKTIGADKKIKNIGFQEEQIFKIPSNLFNKKILLNENG